MIKFLLCLLVLSSHHLRAQTPSTDSDEKIKQFKRISEKLKEKLIFIQSKKNHIKHQTSSLERLQKRTVGFSAKHTAMKPFLESLLAKDDSSRPVVTCWLERLEKKGKLDISCEDEFPEAIKQFRARLKIHNAHVRMMYWELGESKEDLDRKIKAVSELLPKLALELEALETEKLLLENTLMEMNISNLEPVVPDAVSTAQACRQIVQASLDKLHRRHTDHLKGAKIEPTPLEIRGESAMKVHPNTTGYLIPEPSSGSTALLQAQKVKVKTVTNIHSAGKELEEAFPGAGTSPYKNLRLETISISSTHPRFKSDELGKANPKPYTEVELSSELQLLYDGEKLVAMKRLESPEMVQGRKPTQMEFREFSHDPDCGLVSTKNLTERLDWQFCQEYFGTLGTSQVTIDHIPREGQEALTLGDCKVSKANFPDGNLGVYPFLTTEIWNGHNLKFQMDKLAVFTKRYVANGYIRETDLKEMKNVQAPEWLLPACAAVIGDKNQYESAPTLKWLSGRCGSYRHFYKVRGQTPGPSTPAPAKASSNQ
ncbi:MAG TPA: hypothetical protein VNJ01_14230 [Bacteriovoracaceae bacterium]|nr:hypothetical protein [Bacteriovoracaceae bacterium]